jgi:PIN domain nuclease of toxin-antitoxin system
LILDTTYLLPLARIGIDNDLLKLITEEKVTLNDISVNLISIFELQVKASKLSIPSKYVIEAVKAIISNFKVVSFYEPKIIKLSFSLKKYIPDYIDCIILSTAIFLKEDLVTKDKMILSKRRLISSMYKIKVLSYEDFIRKLTK